MTIDEPFDYYGPSSYSGYGSAQAKDGPPGWGRVQPRINDTAPTVFRLKVPISESEMARLRRHFLPGESATQAIRRLALAKVQEVEG